MKRLLTILSCIFCLHVSAPGQETTLSLIRQLRHRVDSILATYESADVHPSYDLPPADTLLPDTVTVSIFDQMPSRDKGDRGNVTLIQSRQITELVEGKALSPTDDGVTGYRIRIYFSNAQNARSESIAAQNRFEQKYPGYTAYRIYSNPNFKVTVCDFRNKSDALRMLEYVKNDFPAAFIVSEKINTPW